MDISVQPDLYCPSLDDNGNYIDSFPKFTLNFNGFYCKCTSRKDKIYETKKSLVSHFKTKCHKNWLENLNNNKQNYYIKYIEANEVIRSQKIIIASLNKELDNKNLTINYLTEQLVNNSLKSDRNNSKVHKTNETNVTNKTNETKIADLIDLD